MRQNRVAIAFTLRDHPSSTGICNFPFRLTINQYRKHGNVSRRFRLPLAFHLPIRCPIPPSAAPFSFSLFSSLPPLLIIDDIVFPAQENTNQTWQKLTSPIGNHLTISSLTSLPPLADVDSQRMDSAGSRLAAATPSHSTQAISAVHNGVEQPKATKSKSYSEARSPA